MFEYSENIFVFVQSKSKTDKKNYVNQEFEVGADAFAFQ